MPQTKNRISSASQKQRKSVEETVGETDSPEVLSPAHKSKQKGPTDVKDGQTTIDKHLKPTENFKNENIEETLKNVSEKLNKLASQAFIESKLKEMVTEEFLSTKLKELEKEVKCQVKKELENVNKQVNELKDRVTKAERSVSDLRNTVSDMEIAMENMQTKTAYIVEENKRMKEQLQEREIKLTVQSEQINNLEQYTRRNTVRLYGLEDQNKDETFMETAKRVAKLVNEKLNVKISTADIDIAHRIGRFSSDANRPIICKFVSRFTKHDVIKARRHLKNSAIVIREDLTHQNAKLLEHTSPQDKVKTAWSDNGKIIALLKNNKKIVVDGKTDFSKIVVSE